MGRMPPDFRGATATHYARFRRGYPTGVIDTLVDAFTLTQADLAADLGCGTGQLTIPLAGRVRAALGLDPEPDMLAEARRCARERGVTNTTWLLAADTDLPALPPLLGTGALGVVTIAQALHWMQPETLFPAVRPLLRAGGGIAIVTNGKPLWQHDEAWSSALREVLERHLGTTLTATCGTAAADQCRYHDLLAATGYTPHVHTVDYADPITLEFVVGNVYSALSADRLPDRATFVADLTPALEPYEPIVEGVRVTILTGRLNT